MALKRTQDYFTDTPLPPEAKEVADQAAASMKSWVDGEIARIEKSINESFSKEMETIEQAHDAAGKEDAAAAAELSQELAAFKFTLNVTDSKPDPEKVKQLLTQVETYLKQRQERWTGIGNKLGALARKSASGLI